MLPECQHEVSRLEAFSDAAFAFALPRARRTPSTSRNVNDELMRTMPQAD